MLAARRARRGPVALGLAMGLARRAPATPGDPWSGSRVSGSHMTLKTLELWGLAPSLSNFSDFEFLTGQHFSDFGSRIMLRIRSNPTSRRRKATPGLRGLSGPAGGADFLGFEHAKVAISLRFCRDQIPRPGRAPNL